MTNIEDKVNVLGKITISDETRQRIADSISSGSKVKSITVKMEATHSGKPNGNFWIYTPYGMKTGHGTFTQPVFKPVTEEHIEDSKTLGRVIKSEYVSYGISDKLERPYDKNYLQDYKKFMLSKEYKSRGFKGLGHVELTAKITDKESIQKILDGKYGFVSVGGGVKSAHCSICGSSKLGKTTCNHVRGAKYQGETCYYIGGIMDFEHISYVGTPADKNAKSTLIRDSKSNTSHFQILDFETDKGNIMTIKIEDFDKSNDSLVQHAKSLGIADYQLPGEDGLTALDYVFGEEKTFPLADKVTALVAYDFAKTQFEDSSDKEAVLRLIQDKLDELEIKDAEAELEAIIQASKVQDSEGEKSEDDEKDHQEMIEKIADAVVAKIQDSISGTSYQNSQIKVLRNEVKTLASAKQELEAELRDSLVSQISSIEKITDSSKLEALKKRSLQSLKDKLSDLIEALYEGGKDDDVEDSKEVKDSQEKPQLPKDSLSIEDGASGSGTDDKDEEKEGSEENGKVEDNEKGFVFKDSKELNSRYLEIMKKEGLQAAKAFKLKAKIG